MTDAVKEETGTLRLTHIPPGREARARVAALLRRLPKNAGLGQAKMEAALLNLPFVISTTAPAGAARRLTAELEKLGAKAQFQPGAGPQEASKQVPPVEEKKKPAPWHKSAKVRLAAALAVIAILGAAGYHLAPRRPHAKNPMPGAKPAANPSAVENSAPVPSKTVAETLAGYEAAHSPMFDRRMADGLAEAVLEYARLFNKGADPLDIEVMYNHERKDDKSFTLKYIIKGKGLDLSVETALTTAPERMGENIPALAAALKDVAVKMAPLVHPPDSLERVRGPARRVALHAMEKMDMAAVFGAMKEMDKVHSTNRVDPYAPLEAGNLLSWMAYIKTANRRQAVADLLAVHAVSNHLVASLFFSGKDGDLMTGRGLALLGLGYPAAALAAAGAQPGANAQLLAVAAKRDLRAAGVEIKEDPVYKRLWSYLGVRLAMENGWLGDSAPKIMAMIKKDPDFILGVEYAVNAAGPGLGGAVMIYAEETGMAAIQIAKDHLSPTPVDGVIAGDDAPGMGPENGAATAIIHAKTAIGSTFRLTQEERILTRHLVAVYLDETLQDAALLCSWAEGPLEKSPDADLTFKKMMERQWPGSSSAKLAWLLGKISSGLYSQGVEAAEKMEAGAADMDLLEELAWFYSQKPEQNAARAGEILAAIRAKANLTPAAAVRLEETFRRLGRKPESAAMIRRALALDPYNPEAYAHVPHLPDFDSLFTAGELVHGGSARFLLEAGNRARKMGRKDEALAYYRRAGLSTVSIEAVAAIARLHMDAGEHAQAEKALREFLRRGGESAETQEGTSLLAEAMLAQGRADDARQLTRELKETGHPGAIRTYALAVERLGAPVEAEIFLRKAADERKTGRAPVDLAMFHLRNGGRKAAGDDLRYYARHNEPSYYFKGAVEQFKAGGDPGGVLGFVMEVENGKLGAEQELGLWSALMDAREYKTAAVLAKSVMTGPEKERAPASAGMYIEASAKADPQGAGAKAALEEAVNAMEKQEGGIKALGAWLLKRGLSREAFAAAEKGVFAPSSGKAGLEAVLTAAWLMSGSFLEGGAVLRKRLQSPGLDPWGKMILQYGLGEMGEDALISHGAANGRLDETLCLIGMARRAKGDGEAAEKLLVMALESAGDDPLWRGLALAALSSGGRDGAGGTGD